MSGRIEDWERARVYGPRIAVIGGGTGLSAMLRGLKRGSENITAIVAMSDDGGGSGVLRNDLGMLPPGDVRNCILALAGAEPMMTKLMNYRFPEGRLTGQSFGNLFLAALVGIYGSFETAAKRMGELLAVTGQVLPVTTADVRLEAEFENDARVLGESRIAAAKKLQKCRIRRVRLVPGHPPALKDALTAIAEADLVVLGPGSLYTSVIPNLLVEGIADAVASSGALRVYVCNVMTQEGESEGYTAFEHVRALLSHSRADLLDVCLCNSAPISEAMRAKYREEGAGQTTIDREAFASAGIELREKALMEEQNGVVRHCPPRLTYALLSLLREKRPRAGLQGRLDDTMLHHLRFQL